MASKNLEQSLVAALFTSIHKRLPPHVCLKCPTLHSSMQQNEYASEIRNNGSEGGGAMFTLQRGDILHAESLKCTEKHPPCQNHGNAVLSVRLLMTECWHTDERSLCRRDLRPAIFSITFQRGVSSSTRTPTAPLSSRTLRCSQVSIHQHILLYFPGPSQSVSPSVVIINLEGAKWTRLCLRSGLINLLL